MNLVLLNTLQVLLTTQESNLHGYVIAGLVVVLTVACIICLFLVFRYVNRVQAEGLQQQNLIDIITKMKKAELYPRIEGLRIEEREQKEKKNELERQLKLEEDTDKKKELRSELYEIDQEFEQIIQKIDDATKSVQEEAEKFAKQQVPSRINWSNAFGPYFYIEIGTIILTIFALLILAITGTVTGQEAVPILAAIIGYVLGKSASSIPKHEKSASISDS